MKVEKHGDRYHVKIEELLPCRRFGCIHESQSCAVSVWCPDGCYDTNTYHGACIPKCMDCVYYPSSCDQWERFTDKHEHSALSNES